MEVANMCQIVQKADFEILNELTSRSYFSFDLAHLKLSSKEWYLNLIASVTFLLSMVIESCESIAVCLFRGFLVRPNSLPIPIKNIASLI
jgi:hypothetical protein